MQSFFFRIFNLLVLTTLASIVNAAAEANAAPPVEIVGYRNYQPMAKRELDSNATTPAHPSKTSMTSPLVWNPSSSSAVVLSPQSTPTSLFSTGEDYASLTSKSRSDPTFSWRSSSEYLQTPFSLSSQDPEGITPPASSSFRSSNTPGIDLTISPSASSKSFYTASSSPLVSISSNAESLFTLIPSLTAPAALSTEPFPVIPSLFPTDSDFQSFLSPISPSSVPVRSRIGGSSSLSSYSLSFASSSSTFLNSFSTSSYKDPIPISGAKDSTVSPPSLVLSSGSIGSTRTATVPSSVSPSTGSESSQMVSVTPTHSSGGPTKSPYMSHISSSTLIHGTSEPSAIPISSPLASARSDIESPSSTSLTPSKSSSVLISSSETSSRATSLYPSTTSGSTSSFHDSIIPSLISTTSDFEGTRSVSTLSTSLELNDTKTTDQRSSTSASSFRSSPLTFATSSSEVQTYQVTPVISSSASASASQSENQTITFSTISAVTSSTVLISITPASSSDVTTSNEYPKSSTLISAPVNSTETVYTVANSESKTHVSSQLGFPSHSTDTPAFTSSISGLLSKTGESTFSGSVTTLTPSVAVPSNTSSEESTLQHTHYSPSVTPGIITISENSTWLPGKPVSSTQTSASISSHSSAVADLGTLRFNTSSITTPVSLVTEKSTSETTSLIVTFSSAPTSYSSRFYNRTATFTSTQTTHAFTSPATSIQSNIPLVSDSQTSFPTDVNTDTNPLPSTFEATSQYVSTTESPDSANLPHPTSETQAPQWLPTRIFTATEAEPTSSDSHITTRTSLASPSTAVPRVIAPPTAVPMANGQTLITVGFKKELNFAFLFSSSYAGAQILEFLPKVLSFPFNISGVYVQQIVPLESKSRDYLVSVALVYFPSDKVNDLKMMIDNSTSPLYESYGGTGRQLASLIDPSIPLKGLAGKSTFHSDTNEDAGSMNAAAHNIGGLDDPQGFHKNSVGDVSKKARTLIGVVVGSSCAAVVLIFLVFNYYYVKRGKRILVDDHSIHSGSSASLENVLLGHQSYKEEKSLQPMSMHGGPTRASVSPTLKIDNWMDYNDNYGRASETNKPSYVNGRITTISAPIASENSLGWDA